MEIMSRSGDFSTVDYGAEVVTVIYDGVLTDCSDFGVVLSPNTVSCTIGQDIYSQDYVEGISFNRVDGSTSHRSKFDFTIKLPVGDVFENLDPAADYEVALSFNAQGRVISCLSPKSGVLSSLSEGASATDLEIRLAVDKVLLLEFTGGEIQSFVDVNNKLVLTIKASWGHTSGWTSDVELANIHVTKVEDNSAVPLAFRNDESYTYGFNGMERDDELSGSGNAYNTEFRGYDPRLGRWKSIDPLAAKFPWQSPYVAFDNNPIIYRDPRGLAAEGGECGKDKNKCRLESDSQDKKPKLIDIVSFKRYEKKEKKEKLRVWAVEGSKKLKKTKESKNSFIEGEVEISLSSNDDSEEEFIISTGGQELYNEAEPTHKGMSEKEPKVFNNTSAKKVRLTVLSKDQENGMGATHGKIIIKGTTVKKIKRRQVLIRGKVLRIF